MALTPEQEDALLRFDTTQLVPFMKAGKPAPRLLQQLKRKGMVDHFMRYHLGERRWSLSVKGAWELQALRRKRGLPDFPAVWGEDAFAGHQEGE